MQEFRYSIRDIKSAVDWILNNSNGKKQFAFYGEMGAGKTTLIKSICEKLGAINTVSSPTFSIINEYQTENDDLIYHFDFYRIERIDEVYEFGLEEYLAERFYCFIEWPERIEEILADNIVKIFLEVEENGFRHIQMKV